MISKIWLPAAILWLYLYVHVRRRILVLQKCIAIDFIITLITRVAIYDTISDRNILYES